MNTTPLMGEGQGRPPAPEITVHHHEAIRSARVCVLGTPGQPVRECWLVCHGYLQSVEHFIEWFRPVAVPGRLIVAPEGLSRAYIDSGQTRVGSSWMTRVDRDREIHDYVRWIDQALDDVGIQSAGRVGLEVHGFSQGAATACRWVAHTHRRVDRVVLWGGGVPPDLSAADLAQSLPQPMILMVGRDDPYLTSEAIEGERERLDRLAIRYRIEYHDGGHKVDPDALLALARSPSSRSQ